MRLSSTPRTRLILIGLAVAALSLGFAVWRLWPAPPPPDNPDPGPDPLAHPPPPDNLPPPTLTPPPASEFPLGAFLAEADFAATLQKTGALYIVVAVSAPDSDESVAQTLALLKLLENWQHRHTALIGITTGAEVVDAERFLRQVGQPQRFALYRAPWFAGKYNLTDAPCLYLFAADGRPLYKASPGAEPVLGQIERRVDELLGMSADPEINPAVASDPRVLTDFWTRKQIQLGQETLAGLAVTLKPIVTDQPGAGDTLQQLEARYRPLLKKAGLAYGWVYKGWPGTPDPRWAKVSLVDDETTRYGPPAVLLVGFPQGFNEVGGQPATVQMRMVWDKTASKPLLQIQYDPPAYLTPGLPATTPEANRTRTRFFLWVETEMPPALLIERWNQGDSCTPTQ